MASSSSTSVGGSVMVQRFPRVFHRSPRIVHDVSCGYRKLLQIPVVVFY